MHHPTILKKFDYSKSCKFVSVSCESGDFDEDLDHYYIVAVSGPLILSMLNIEREKIISVLKNNATKFGSNVVLITEEHNGLGIIESVLVHESDSEGLSAVENFIKGM